VTAFERLYGRLWRVLVQWFRVPDAPPEPPIVDAGEACDRFKPDAAFLRYLKTWFWILLVALDSFLLLLYVAVAAGLVAAGLWWVALLLLPFLAAFLLVPGIVWYVALHLRYDTTWYAMTDRSLRIRRGIWIIHETTITFENVQNLSVRQGPLERCFGISRLIVETAGAGGDPQEGRSHVANVGVVEGITEPARLKARILGRLGSSRSTGLGDHDETPAWTPAHVAALRSIRDLLTGN